MASGVKFYDFSEAVAKGIHRFHTDQFYVCLTTSVPQLTNTVYADLSEVVENSNGYTAGGRVATLSSVSETTGTCTVTLLDPATWTAVTNPIQNILCAVLYNYSTTLATKPLVCYWQYGQNPLTLAAGESLTVDLAGPIITFPYA